jgi:hypothetical protein
MLKGVIGRWFIVDIGDCGAYFQAFASEGRQDEHGRVFVD